MINRREFGERNRSAKTTVAPACLDPLTGRLIESRGFEAAYIVGANGRLPPGACASEYSPGRGP